MSEDRFNSQSHVRDSWLFPHIFRSFTVAIDPKKLLLAAAGILVMALGWYLISVVFYGMWSKPSLEQYQVMSDSDYERKYPNKSREEREEMRRKDEANRNARFNRDSERWLLLHRLAGTGPATVEFQPENGMKRPDVTIWGGRLRIMPWFEDRGPNPYLMVTGQVERPWESGKLTEWFISTEVPVLIEPLVKFLEPIIHLLNPKTGTLVRLYLVLILLWTLATWALFGGAITRMASVELTGKDSISMREALRFTLQRYVSYILGPIVPIGLVALLVFVSIIFGFLHMIPALGDIFFSGLLWPVVLLIGLGMALLLVGLVGYPMMYATISTEGSDTLDALSRSYNYVYQAPWSYFWYSLVALLYGAVVIFFVGFMGSLTVYLGKWGVAQTPWINSANRSPEFLFIYTPTSFGWREVLMTNSPAEDWVRLQSEIDRLRRRGLDESAINAVLLAKNENRQSAEQRHKEYLDSFLLYNHLGAIMVSFWITLVFLMVLGFGYSFFWTAATMIYLLMRKKVDDIDLDEVYLEETDDLDKASASFKPTGASLTPTEGGNVLQVQPTLTVRNDRPPSTDAATATSSPPVGSTPTPSAPTGFTSSPLASSGEATSGTTSSGVSPASPGGGESSATPDGASPRTTPPSPGSQGSSSPGGPTAE